MKSRRFSTLRARVADPFLGARGFLYSGHNTYWNHHSPFVSIINLQTAAEGGRYITNIGLHFDFSPTSSLVLIPPEQLDVAFCEFRTRTCDHRKPQRRAWMSYVDGTPEERKRELEGELTASIQLLAAMATKWEDLSSLVVRYTPEILAKEVRSLREIRWDNFREVGESIRQSIMSAGRKISRLDSMRKALKAHAAACAERSVLQHDFPGWDVSLPGVIRAMALIAKQLGRQALLREYVDVAMLEMGLATTSSTPAQQIWRTCYLRYLRDLVDAKASQG